MKFLNFLLLIIIITSVSNAQQVFQHEKLTKVWETKEGLKTPESAIYNEKEDVLYVSNINEKSWENDGNGFISKLSIDGNYIKTDWITGLSGPKGMGIYNGKLYVADITEVVEIDIKKGQIIGRFTHERAKRMNDITIGKDGTVYISDSGDSCIYALKNGKIEVFVESGLRSNGLLALEKELLAGSKGRLVSIDLKTKQYTVLNGKTGSIDGLEPVGDGTYLISDWTGNVYHVQQDKSLIKLLDTTPIQSNAADIWYIKEKQLLLVPTFNHNTLAAYKFKP